MIKLEMNEQMKRAAERAAKNRNFVVRIAPGTYTVVSGHSHEDYQVTFRKGADGSARATCTCPAGQNEMACHHLISAGWLHKGLVRMARQARTQQALAA